MALLALLPPWILIDLVSGVRTGWPLAIIGGIHYFLLAGAMQV